jgi:hypothetical protein
VKWRVLRQTSGALRPDCGSRRRFAGFWRFGAVEKSSTAKGLSPRGIGRPLVRYGFSCRMRQLCNAQQRARSMCCSRSVGKFQRSEALAPELRFAHGSNINARDECCGKLKASGFCAKCLAAKSGQGGDVNFGREKALVQP